MKRGGVNKAERSLATLPESERSAALARFHLLRPFLEDGVPLTHIAAECQLPLRTLRRWVAQYRVRGLTGLVRIPRSDRGQRRSLTAKLQRIIEGLALQKPQRTTATIHRETIRICREHNWTPPSYSTVQRIVSQLDPALTTLAHEGAKVYREEFDLIYRHQAAAPNEVWQADHSLLPVLLLNEVGQPMRPWLTIILDDFSRAVAGYYLGFAAPTAQQTALTLHQAIWRKSDPRWHVCGIPVHFYTDNGADFTSDHLEQVAADLKMSLVFSWPGHPRGRGKIERFFRTVEQRFLPGMPGFEGRNGTTSGTHLSLAEFDARFRDWLLDDYQNQARVGSAISPKARWEAGGFLPHLPESLEQLDLLLAYVAKQRRVQQDGIHFQGQRYFDTNLAAYVGEDVTIRYDPRDIAVIRVFYRDHFLCHAICTELAGMQVSLKEVITARKAQRQRVRRGIAERLSALDPRQILEPPEQRHAAQAKPPVPQLKRYVNE